MLLQEKVPTISTLNNVAGVIYCIQLSEFVQQVQNKLHYETCIFVKPTGSSIKTFSLYDQAYTLFRYQLIFKSFSIFLNLNVHYVKSACQSSLSKSKIYILKVQVIMAVKIKNVSVASLLHLYFLPYSMTIFRMLANLLNH